MITIIICNIFLINLQKKELTKMKLPLYASIAILPMLFISSATASTVDKYHSLMDKWLNLEAQEQAIKQQWHATKPLIEQRIQLIKEERRLFFVAITRAIRKLVLTCVEGTANKPNYYAISRFFAEMEISTEDIKTEHVENESC